MPTCYNNLIPNEASLSKFAINVVSFVSTLFMRKESWLTTTESFPSTIEKKQLTFFS